MFELFIANCTINPFVAASRLNRIASAPEGLRLDRHVAMNDPH
jgi:hypothetical protein